MGMNPSAPRAGRREWLGLAVLALPCLVYAMDLTVLNLAVPALSADLRPTSTQLLWILDVYGFMVAGALITMGALGDRIGGRRLLLIGAAAFAGASVLAAFASSAGMLIAARALLGLAGAIVAPSTLSLIRTMFRDDAQRTVAIGIWVTSYSLGAAVGPLAGGALLELFWWGSVFLLAVPVMAVVLVAGPRLLPEHRHPEAGRLDLVSAALSLVAMLAVVYGLKGLATAGPVVGSMAWIAGGLAVGAAFVRRQRALADPLLDIGLLRVPRFTAALSANLVAFFVIFGMSLFLAQYLQSVLGLSPLEAGAWTVPDALGFIGGSMLTPRLATRWASPAVLAAGMLVGAAGYAVVAGADGGLAPIVVGSAVGRARARRGRHARDGSRDQRRSAGPSGGGGRHVGDLLGARRGARDRDPRQHRRRGLPRGPRRRSASGRPGRRARDPGGCAGRRRGARARRRRAADRCRPPRVHAGPRRHGVHRRRVAGARSAGRHGAAARRRSPDCPAGRCRPVLRSRRHELSGSRVHDPKEP